MTSHSALFVALAALFVITQCLYLAGLAVDCFLYTRRVDWVDPADVEMYEPDDYPRIILLYPVLRELEQTMRTTFLGLTKMDYPSHRFRVVAIPNTDDEVTLEALDRLRDEFAFLEVMPIPPTTDPSWNVVWQAWDSNPKAYWWHVGKRVADRRLPPKKTRQLIYAFYTLAACSGRSDWLLNYIDADSVPPPDHFLAGAVGMERYDVVQATNVAGNLLDTWPSTWHAMDHMGWDGSKYPHLTANGKQPYWVLGKGLFYRASDLVAVGGFNPWLTIEDPEVGMRLWTNGRRLGVVAKPLIEEVPLTLRHGITQRKRWVCGFFQSLHTPLKLMGMNWRQRFRARLNFLPCLLLLNNAIGLPIGIWAFVELIHGSAVLPRELYALSAVNIAGYSAMMILLYRTAWKRTALVLNRSRERVRFMLRVNPLFLIFYWLVWTVPLVIGIQMFLRDRGQVWERTEKVDANNQLVRVRGGLAGAYVSTGRPSRGTLALRWLAPAAFLLALGLGATAYLSRSSGTERALIAPQPRARSLDSGTSNAFVIVGAPIPAQPRSRAATIVPAQGGRAIRLDLAPPTVILIRRPRQTGRDLRISLRTSEPARWRVWVSVPGKRGRELGIRSDRRRVELAYTTTTRRSGVVRFTLHLRPKVERRLKRRSATVLLAARAIDRAGNTRRLHTLITLR